MPCLESTDYNIYWKFFELTQDFIFNIIYMYWIIMVATVRSFEYWKTCVTSTSTAFKTPITRAVLSYNLREDIPAMQRFQIVCFQIDLNIFCHICNLMALNDTFHQNFKSRTFQWVTTVYVLPFTHSNLWPQYKFNDRFWVKTALSIAKTNLKPTHCRFFCIVKSALVTNFQWQSAKVTHDLKTRGKITA